MECVYQEKKTEPACKQATMKPTTWKWTQLPVQIFKWWCMKKIRTAGIKSALNLLIRGVYIQAYPGTCFNESKMFQSNLGTCWKLTKADNSISFSQKLFRMVQYDPNLPEKKSFEMTYVGSKKRPIFLNVLTNALRKKYPRFLKIVQHRSNVLRMFHVFSACRMGQQLSKGSCVCTNCGSCHSALLSPMSIVGFTVVNFAEVMLP